jgi:thiol-disulfide isomerase/thioredoxin
MSRKGYANYGSYGSSDDTDNNDEDSLLYLTNDMYTKGGDLSGPRTQYTFVMIQSAHCGYCQLAKPMFKQLANHLAGHESVTIATVQADAEPELYQLLTKKLKLRGVPAYFLYKGKKVIGEYNGDRSVNDMVEFLNANM